jgi:hypothetical protein
MCAELIEFVSNVVANCADFGMTQHGAIRSGQDEDHCNSQEEFVVACEPEEGGFVEPMSWRWAVAKTEDNKNDGASRTDNRAHGDYGDNVSSIEIKFLLRK